MSKGVKKSWFSGPYFEKRRFGHLFLSKNVRQLQPWKSGVHQLVQKSDLWPLCSKIRKFLKKFVMLIFFDEFLGKI